MMVAGGAKAGVDDLFGILSLMFWSLIVVVTVVSDLRDAGRPLVFAETAGEPQSS